jgi:prepilin-type N-terminal cleavage/methylation domain-containing protein
MTQLTHIRRSEDGFTLVEILVAVTLSLIILFATLQSLDAFTTSAAHQTKVTDANAQVRATMDRTVNDLRGASTIRRATATDLVYTVPETGGTRMSRLCVSSDDLYGSDATTATAPTSAPATACSAGTQLATLKSNATTAFSYDGAATAATPSKVKNVGLTLSLEATSTSKSTTSTLQASAARRAAGTLPLPEGDGGLDSTCNASGALLSLSANIPNAGTLSVTYENDGGIAIGTPVTGGVQIPKGLTHVVARVTDAAGATNIIRKDVECNGS